MNRSKRILKYIRLIIENDIEKLDSTVKWKLMNGLEWLLTNVEIQGDTDGIKLTFKKKV